MTSASILTATDSAAEQLASNATEIAANVTSLLNASSAKTIVSYPLRLLARFDRFLFTTLPRTIVYGTGINHLANRAADLFRNGEGAAGVAAAVGAAGAEAIEQAAGPPGPSWGDLFYEALQASTNRNYWGMLHYVTSRWAFTCFLMALVLNRVTIYGSSRQRIVLSWNKRLALRLIPIILFITQIHRLIQAIQCQTSPNFSLYRHGDNNKYSILDWSTDGGPLHTLSSTILFWSTDEQSCAAVGMSRPEPDVRAPYGSFSLLWPTFLRLSLSHLVENLSCSLQQVTAMTEVGLSVFEHSLAFAEAESMVAHTLSKKISKSANATATVTAVMSSITPEGTIPASGTILAITDAAQAFIGPHLFDRINVPAEVLLVAILSCGNCLTSHVISILGKKNKWRLVSTGFWGLCYMTAFVWGFFAESEMVRIDGGVPKPVSGLLHFPTVAIVGFLPHMAVILGVLVCGIIYLVALLLTAVSLGSNPNLRRPTSLKERVSIAHDNLQAAIQLRAINIRWYEDFYTALLRIGFAALTAASEAVFLNEGRAVEMRQFTWLEEEHLDDLDAARSVRPKDEAHFQIIEEYGVPDRGRDEQGRQVGEWKSGYEKERKLEKKDKNLQSKDSFIYPNPRTDGVGAMQRTTRFLLLFIFIRGILFTIGGWISFGIGAFLDRIGITARPTWARRVIGGSLKQLASDRERLQHNSPTKKFDEYFQPGGTGSRPSNEDVDVENEMRMRIASENHENPQDVLDERMYDWWKSGGWYGTKDESGDYVSSTEPEEDATSVVTTTTSTSSIGEDQDAWVSEPEGARTPTQQHPVASWSFDNLRQRRSETPEPETPLLDVSTLVRLLNPPNKESRDEARILSSHLVSDTGVMTRSRFRRQFEADRAKVLLAGRAPTRLNVGTSGISSSRKPLASDEEAHLLEQLLLSRRIQKQRPQSRTPLHQESETSGLSSHSPDGTNFSQNGPPCVVCQSEPRTIIAWPCRCLIVCEECRVNLAMNNFGNCVTCRRNVGGFVRLFVP